ncbi:MAG: hypothetical protein HRT57_05505 [Crocinitomicaceae bacterium]|nr:hypothetical protein [Crocinitomicaceae bacterium]
MVEKDVRSKIIDLLINKAAVKQDVADYSEEILGQFKEAIQTEIAAFRKEVNDNRIRLKFDNKGSHEFIAYIGSDVLVFQLHRNIFRLQDDDPLWETDYLKENGANGYFGMINIYNFLAESYEKNRFNDAGYLIGRVFMNHEKNCMVEGKGDLGDLFKDLENSKMTPDLIRDIVQSAIAFAVGFDLITPPYDLVQEVTVMQVQEVSSDLQIATGKRLGFKFSKEGGDIF